MQHIPEALTFDDVLLVPGYSQVLPHEVSLKTQLTRDISLNIPLLSAAMDTVTEAPLAIRLAEAGGVGIIHKNMSIERQALEISKVKKYESGIIKDPVTVKPDTKLAEVVAIAKANQFSGMPVVDGDQLVGIITSRDMRFETNLEQPVKNLMTPQERLVTVREGATRDEVIHLFKKHRIEKVLIVDEQFALKGMMTVKDILKSEQNPYACKDSEGQLRVGAAVGVRANTLERVTALVTAGVDVVAVDTAHGFTKSVIDTVKLIRQHFPHLPLIAGNVATAEGAEALITAGADGIKVGMGPGSICTTRIIAGIGVPQITAVHDVAQIAAKQNIPVIADGGIRFSGDICKAIAAGASTVMIGSLFAGTEEAPGEVVLYKGRSYKAYRGMGSVGAMVSGSSDRYFQVDQEENQKYVPEGIEGRVPYKGPLMAMVHQLTGGIRASMGYTGCETIEEMRTKAKFVRISNAGIVESHVHDVFITKEAPNYQRGDVKE